jgi:hypothetical protein
MLIKNKVWYPWLVVALLWGVALLNYEAMALLWPIHGHGRLHSTASA